MLIARFEDLSCAALNTFLQSLRGLWGLKSLHGNVALKRMPAMLTLGSLVDVLEQARKLIITQQHPATASDMGLIQYDGDMSGFHVWSEEPANHVRITCDLHTVIVDVAAGTEEQLRAIVAQSGTSGWAFMATSGAVTEGSLDEVVAMEMAAQANEAVERG